LVDSDINYSKNADLQALYFNGIDITDDNVITSERLLSLKQECDRFLNRIIGIEVGDDNHADPRGILRGYANRLFGKLMEEKDLYISARDGLYIKRRLSGNKGLRGTNNGVF